MNFIKSAFESLWAHITGLSTSVWLYLETYVLPVLKSGVGTLLMDLAPVALKAVTDAEAQGGSNSDKFSYALNQIKSAAVTSSTSVGASVLNTLVENALQQLKASQATAGSASAGGAASGAA
ncbi:MAG: phage holin, LLH family [Chthoniobacteraceae bacterium]